MGAPGESRCYSRAVPVALALRSPLCLPSYVYVYAGRASRSAGASSRGATPAAEDDDMISPEEVRREPIGKRWEGLCRDAKGSAGAQQLSHQCTRCQPCDSGCGPPACHLALVCCPTQRCNRDKNIAVHIYVRSPLSSISSGCYH